MAGRKRASESDSEYDGETATASAPPPKKTKPSSSSGSASVATASATTVEKFSKTELNGMKKEDLVALVVRLQDAAAQLAKPNGSLSTLTPEQIKERADVSRALSRSVQCKMG